MPIPTLRKWLGIELVEVSLTEKFVAALGGGIAILVMILLSCWALPGDAAVAVIASMGASAVLLFGVPHGQLSQPWPVLAGHGVSAFIGVACAQMIPSPLLATACAVGLAIGAIHQLKCIHPPGGATTFTAVMGGSAIHDLGYRFVLVPVLANAAVMVLLAVLINYVFKWRRYPVILSWSSRAPVPVMRGSPEPPTHEQIVEAVKSLDSFVDISEEDLVRLVALLSIPSSDEFSKQGPGSSSRGGR